MPILLRYDIFNEPDIFVKIGGLKSMLSAEIVVKEAKTHYESKPHYRGNRSGSLGDRIYYYQYGQYDYGDDTELVIDEPAVTKPDTEKRKKARISLKELYPKLKEHRSQLQKSYDSCRLYQIFKKAKIRKQLDKADQFLEKYPIEIN